MLEGSDSRFSPFPVPRFRFPFPAVLVSPFPIPISRRCSVGQLLPSSAKLVECDSIWRFTIS